MFDEFIKQVRIIRQEKERATSALNQDIALMSSQLAALTKQRDEIGVPYTQQESDLIDEWKDRIIIHGGSYESADGKIKFRKGYVTTTYNKDVVSTILATLKDLAPNLAEKLEKAKKETTTPPSFTIEIKENDV